MGFLLWSCFDTSGVSGCVLLLARFSLVFHYFRWGSSEFPYWHNDYRHSNEVERDLRKINIVNRTKRGVRFLYFRFIRLASEHMNNDERVMK